MTKPSAATFFRQLSDWVEEANRTARVEPLLLNVGGYIIETHCSSPVLRERLRRPMASLEVAGNGTRPELTLELADIGSQALPALPWTPQATSVEQNTSEYLEDPYIFTRHSNVLLTGADLEHNRTIGVVHDPAHWPLRYYKQSIFITLYQHLRRRGMFLIHASAIGRDGRVILVAGHSGAGKTTTMLTCVRAGFDFLGDDTTLIARNPDGSARVISLLSTLNVTDKTVAWFPELRPHLSEERNHKGKRQVLISEVYPGSMAPDGQVAMILVPQVTDQETTTIVPTSKLALLSELLLNSLDLHEASAAQTHLDFLATLLETVPSYRIRLGRDRERLPLLLGEFLEKPS